MPTVKCRGCGASFKVSGPGERCPVCDKVCKEPQTDGDTTQGRKSPAVKTSTKAAAATRCPVCHKPLTPGVKFCAACGADIGTADVGDAIMAGMKFEEESAKNIARARWQIFFGRLFRWW
jgi:rRNA maturation endonuclease Nob1